MGHNNFMKHAGCPSDGGFVFFRAGRVTVYDATQKAIHQDIEPESANVDTMAKAPVTLMPYSTLV